MHVSIWLKCGICIGGLKVNTSIIFEVNLIKIQGDGSDFAYKTKLNFCHAYRANRFKKQAEKWHAVKLNI